jgi:hypothetical protein
MRSLALTDFNVDGLMDIVFLNSVSNGLVTILAQQPNGTLGPTKRDALRTEPSKLAVRRMRLAMHPPIISGFPMANSAIIDDPGDCFV